jgi:hypothetical protein
MHPDHPGIIGGGNGSGALHFDNPRARFDRNQHRTIMVVIVVFNLEPGSGELHFPSKHFLALRVLGSQPQALQAMRHGLGKFITGDVFDRQAHQA